MKPDFTLSKIKQLLLEHWGITGDLSIPGGYEDQNIKIITKTREEFIFKITYDNDNLPFLKSQNKILKDLVRKIPDYSFSEPVKNLDGIDIINVEHDGNKYICRLLKWVEGEIWDNIDKPQFNLLSELGKFCATLDNVLLQYKDEHFSRTILWDINNFNSITSYISYINDDKLSIIIQYFFKEYSSILMKSRSSLRMSIIHNDINNFNLIVDKSEQSISGLIDFGDMVFTLLINELAITISYALIKSDDLLETASTIAKSYHQSLPLLKEEINILYFTIGMRLSMSVLFSAKHRADFSKDNALFVSETDSINSLMRWYKIDQNIAKEHFLSILF